VDQKQVAAAAQIVAGRHAAKGKAPRTYTDYRKMLAEKDLDVCLVGTPDHWHPLIAIDAMKAGCDLYLQKPISVDVLEGKAILDTARKLNRVVQIGMQRRSTPHLIDAIEKVIQPGLLGRIGHVDLCCYYHMRANGNYPVHAVPDTFDYEMWTGPAPLRPFDGPPDNYGGLPHLRWWRTFMEYSNGIVGDMCVHMLDTARWMLGLGWPTRVSSNGGIFVQKDGKSNISDTQSARFEFEQPYPLTVSWEHRTWGNAPDPEYPWALFIHGEKGTLKASVHKFEFFPTNKKQPTITGTNLIELDKYPEDDAKADQGGDKDASAAVRGQMRNWLEARAHRDTPGKNRPVADIEQGYISTASCILANISMDLNGRTLEWDPATHTVKNDAEANRRLKRPYRQGYTHPADAGA
jgi:predicted dehydrogenase